MLKRLLLSLFFAPAFYAMQIQQVKNTNVTVPNVNIANMKSRIDRLTSDMESLEESVLALQIIQKDSHLILFRQMQLIQNTLNHIIKSINAQSFENSEIRRENLEHLTEIMHNVKSLSCPDNSSTQTSEDTHSTYLELSDIDSLNEMFS